MWFLYERLWITRGCYATMYLAALQAVFQQLGSSGMLMVNGKNHTYAKAFLKCIGSQKMTVMLKDVLIVITVTP